MPDEIDHPSHDNHGKIEAIDVIEDWKLGFHLGSVIKYICLCDHKDASIDDLRKAAWYLAREIERREAQDRRDEADRIEKREAAALKKAYAEAYREWNERHDREAVASAALTAAEIADIIRTHRESLRRPSEPVNAPPRDCGDPDQGEPIESD